MIRVERKKRMGTAYTAVSLSHNTLVASSSSPRRVCLSLCVSYGWGFSFSTQSPTTIKTIYPRQRKIRYGWIQKQISEFAYPTTPVCCFRLGATIICPSRPSHEWRQPAAVSNPSGVSVWT